MIGKQDTEELITITAEEYKFLKQIEKSYDPFWFCSFGGCEGACKTCIKTCEMSLLVKAKKEFYEDILKLEAYNDGQNLLYYKCHIDQVARNHHILEVEQ